MAPRNLFMVQPVFPEYYFMNVSFNISITNIDRIHDIALSNQIWSLLLWGDLHPAPNIFFAVSGVYHPNFVNCIWKLQEKHVANESINDVINTCLALVGKKMA